MRRFAALTSVLVMLGTVTAVLTGATASYAAGAKVSPGSLWTLTTQTGCETDSFATTHAFSTALDYGTGDAGKYIGTKKIKMTWTRGAANGDVFKGTWHKSSGGYSGADTHGGLSTPATLAPATTVGCSTVTSTPTTSTITLGTTDNDNATVTGADGIAPTGTLSFYVCGPDATETACTTATGTALGTPVALSGASGNIASGASAPYVPGSAGTYCFLAVYSGDSLYPPSSDGTTTDECFGVTSSVSGLTTAVTSSSIALGSSDTDTATVTGIAGATAPSGTVSFLICGPLTDTEACSGTSPADGGGTPAGSALLGAGATASSSTATSPPVTPTATGTYCFFADYSGDDNFSATSESSATDECFTVIGPSPDLSTTPANYSVELGAPDSDTATVTGSNDLTPTGTVAFYVCGPDDSRSCTTSSGTPLGSPVALTGAGGASATAPSASFTATATGSYCFLAAYSGDANYGAVIDTNDNECFTVNPAPPAPLALGGGENSFGTGTLDLGAGSPTDIWAAVNGYCTSKENGDEFLSAFDATWNGTTWACSDQQTTATPTATANYEYDPAGYTYDVVTPDPTGILDGALVVQAYDPAYEPTACTAGGTSPDTDLAPGSTITTTYSLDYAPVPGDSADDQPVAGIDPYVAPSGDQSTCGQWATLFTIPQGAPNGTYRLHVSTLAGEANSDGANAYSLRVFSGDSFTRCSTVTTVAWYSPTCPVIEGQTALSVFANAPGTTGTFALVQVPATDAGSTMDVNLFDPGEGDHDIELLDPDGVSVPFTWQTTDGCPLPAPNAASTDCAQDLGFSALSGSGTDLDVSGIISVPAGEASHSEFNDREVQLAVTVPADYTADNGGWWSVKYISGANVQDRTTWTVSLTAPPADVSSSSLLRGRKVGTKAGVKTAGTKKAVHRTDRATATTRRPAHRAAAVQEQIRGT